MKNTLLVLLFVFIVLPLGIQLIPVSRDNPPVDPALALKPDPAIEPILKKACYDCHSHETIWPWYSKWAPVSWFITTNVKNGRKAMNFSTWNELNGTKERIDQLHEIKRLTSRRVMPMALYTWQHPTATLNWDEIDAIGVWVDGFPEMASESADKK